MDGPNTIDGPVTLQFFILADPARWAKLWTPISRVQHFRERTSMPKLIMFRAAVRHTSHIICYMLGYLATCLEEQLLSASSMAPHPLLACSDLIMECGMRVRRVLSTKE
mmetsp:Transcript_18207/g.29918  ORF Transcript_18207/g.29918 Transcript_18207/m.29918 type:complete len:109 (-) Transcript_18207:438-764(-)